MYACGDDERDEIVIRTNAEVILANTISEYHENKEV